MQWCWCRRKMAALQFCIDFCHLNACIKRKKDSYPLPRIQEALESLVGAEHFSCLDLKSGFWQIRREEASKQYTGLYSRQLGIFLMWLHTLWAQQHALVTFQWLMQNCLDAVKPYLLLDLPWWLDPCSCKLHEGAPPPTACHVWPTQGV